MSLPKPSDPAKLFLSAIYADREKFALCRGRLEERFGLSDYQSKEIAFSESSYYHQEMGQPLFRQFLSFRDLIRPEDLPAIKLFTNSLEAEAADPAGPGGRRRVNLDPGYLNLTLIYESGTFKALPWTYPDYGGQALIGMLNRLREVYKDHLRQAVEA